MVDTENYIIQENYITHSGIDAQHKDTTPINS